MDRTPKRIITISLVSLAILGLVGYAYLQSKEYLRGPVLTVDEPQNGSVSTSSRIIFRGSAHNVSFLTLNGRQIFTDEQGRFRESLLLPDGYSIMTLEAKDRFGHRTEKRLELVYKPSVLIPPFLKEVPRSSEAEDLEIPPAEDGSAPFIKGE